MKIPQSPPSIQSFFKKGFNPERFLKLTEEASLTDNQERYLHWEELRHKTPPTNLSIEEWWFSIRFARRSSAQALPFTDRQNRKFSYTEPPELKKLMRYIDMNAGGLLGSGKHTVATQDSSSYMRRSLIEEPFSSSLIEGAVTTRDIAKKMIFENRPPKTKDERMVMNNFNGMEFVKSIQSETLMPSHILELHKIMTEGTLENPQKSGALRNNEDNVAVVDDSTNEILHMPPPAETLAQRLENLCSFANNNDQSLSYFCHPLLRAITLHFMLAFDHPFVDGNGRTARALFYWLLMKEGYWLMEYSSISSIIAQAPTAYYKAFLFSETDEGDLTYFFLHQAQTTQKALIRMHQYADEKRKEYERFHHIINTQKLDRPINERQTYLIQDFILKREKQTEISDYQKLHKVSYLTARNDLEDLVARKLVRKIKKGRSSIYLPQKDLQEQLPLI